MTVFVDRTLARSRQLSQAVTEQTHNIDDITGLQSALNGKATSNHTHAVSDVLLLQTALNSKAGSSHTHLAADVTDLSDAVSTLVGGLGLGGGSDPWTWQKLALDNAVSTTALANVTGMSFTALPLTTYLVQVFGAYTAAATTTGIGLALDVPTGSTVIGQTITSLSVTTLGGTEQIADAASTGTTTGTRAVNTNAPIQYWAVVSVGASGGAIQLMQRSEIAASATTLKAGITVMGRRII